MQNVLQNINSVEGVMGSAVLSMGGQVLVHAFPPLIDAATLQKAAGLALDCAYGLQISDTLESLDLRYAEGRLIIRSFPGAMLCLLCAKNVNLQMLNITLNLAVKKLETHIPREAAPSEPVPVPAAVQPGAAEPAVDDGILRMRIGHLVKREASNSFDSLGMIAVSQPTSGYITEFFKQPFKKLTLSNLSAGTSGTFPVMVMKDMDMQYDGMIIVGPGIEKKLGVSEGDKVEVKIG